MLAGDLHGLEHPFLDRHRWHNDHEFGETIIPVQCEDRPQIHIRLAGSRLHLDSEIPGGQPFVHRQSCRQLHLLQISQQVIFDQQQTIADSDAIVEVCLASATGVASHGEGGTADLLAPEQIRDRTDRRQLEIETGFKVQFHISAFRSRWCLARASRSRSNSARNSASLGRYSIYFAANSCWLPCSTE